MIDACHVPAEHLVAIIAMQNALARGATDLQRTMATVVEHAVALTGATGGIAELIEREASAVRATSGAASEQIRVASVACVPVVCDGEPVGMLEVLSDRPHAFGAGATETLALLADAIAAAVHRARAKPIGPARIAYGVATRRIRTRRPDDSTTRTTLRIRRAR